MNFPISGPVVGDPPVLSVSWAAPPTLFLKLIVTWVPIGFDLLTVSIALCGERFKNHDPAGSGAAWPAKLSRISQTATVFGEAPPSPVITARPAPEMICRPTSPSKKRA